MADRPILFSAPMIQALLAGRKTQTRRVIAFPGVEKVIDFVRVAVDEIGRPVYEMKGRDGSHLTRPAGKGLVEYQFWPNFAVGDRLWVREAWSHTGQGVFEIAQARLVGRGGVIYAADKNPRAPHAQFWPSIHMPREFSRLTLIVTDMRVERLQDISWADALAEGVEMESADPPFYYVPGIHPHSLTAVGVEELGGRHAERSFAKLWDLINAKRGFGWAANPWVCAVTFTVHRCNIDSMEAAGA